MNNKILILLSLLVLVPKALYAQIPEEIKGPFYYLTQETVKQEVSSGITDTDQIKNLENKRRHDMLLGDVPVIKKDESPGTPSDRVIDYHTVYSSSEKRPFIFYGGMQGTADTMQSEAMVKLMSQNLTGVVPVYLSAVAMTEPALHDSLTESTAFSQRMVGQMYQQEKHFLGQLEAYPVLRRFIQEKYKACVYAHGKKNGDKGSWIAAQAACLGDSYVNAEEKFKEVETNFHFTKFDNDNSVKTILKQFGLATGNRVTSWLFDEQIAALRKNLKVEGKDNDGSDSDVKSPQAEHAQKVIDQLEKAKNQFVTMVGDMEIVVPKEPPTAGPTPAPGAPPVAGNDSRIIQMTLKVVEGVKDKKPQEVLNVFAKQRYDNVLRVMTWICSDTNAASIGSNGPHNVMSDGDIYEPDQDDIESISIPGWMMNRANIESLYEIYKKSSKPNDEGFYDCNALSSIGDAEFKPLAENSAAGNNNANTPPWARKYMQLAYLLGGADRQYILSGMWKFVASRAGTVAGQVGKQAYADVAFSLIQKKSGFSSPEVGINAIFSGLNEFWAGIKADLDDENNQVTTGLSTSLEDAGSIQ